MRTLHPGLRVTDISASLAFYTTLGYTVVGSVPGSPLGDLTLLRLPDDEFAALELIHDTTVWPSPAESGFSHLAIQVESLTGLHASLVDAGYQPGEITRPGGEDGPKTCWMTDPDGYGLELTEWPGGHPAGLTKSDFV